MTGRVTIDWAEWELDILEAYYSLEGGAAVRARLAKRGSIRKEFSIRHKASRLDLSSDMQEFTPARTVAKEAGVDTKQVVRWVERSGHRKHCRTWGRALLLPAPLVRLYLHTRIPRRATRPKGWWGEAKTAEFLHMTRRRLWQHAARNTLTAVRVEKTMFYDPHSVQQLADARRAALPRPHELPVRSLAAAAGLNVARDLATLPKTTRHPVGGRPAHYTTADAARAFLSKWGHRQEYIDTLVRRLLLVDASRVK